MAAEMAGLPFWELTFDEQGDPDARATRLVPRRGSGPWRHRPDRLRARLEQRPPHRDGALHPLLRRARPPGPAGGARHCRAGGRVLAVAALVRRADPGLRGGRHGGRRGRHGRVGSRCRRRCRGRSRPWTRRRWTDCTRCSPRPSDRWTRWRPCWRDRRTTRRSRSSAVSWRSSPGSPPRVSGRRRGRQGRCGPAHRRAADAARRPHRRCSGGTATRWWRTGWCSATPAAASPGSATRWAGCWHGAKEALRQATYWQMKNRAGTVGRNGLGPLLGRLPAGVRVHLVGHSFGARLVSFALAGLPAGAPSPVRAVTLLQGAFSHFAFASPLPFDAGRSGALAGMLARIDGPLVGLLLQPRRRGRHVLPAGLVRRPRRLGGAPTTRSLGGAGWVRTARRASVPRSTPSGGAGSPYGFSPGAALNIDASEVCPARPAAERRAQRHRAPGADLGRAGGGRSRVAAVIPSRQGCPGAVG